MSISTIITLVSLALGIYKTIDAAIKAAKAKKYSLAASLSDQTLKGLVAVIETLPQNATTDLLKNKIQQASLLLGTESEKLAGIVEEITSLIESVGIKRDGNLDSVLRAAAAVKEARNAK